ncbi:MAG: BON domain-containing protein [Proteobacteria bacterium]|nr:BON domain-containing protein [Pseudomonadota bacterium]
MKLLKNCKLVGISLLLIIGLNACGKPGPAETAGKRIDQTADEAGKKINQVADEAGKRVGEAAAKAEIKIGAQGEKAGVAIADAEITAKIKAAIFAEPGLKSLQISVDTAKGVVTLSGSVNSQQNSDMARGLASAVAGVNGVENRLVLKPTN